MGNPLKMGNLSWGRDSWEQHKCKDKNEAGDPGKMVKIL